MALYEKIVNRDTKMAVIGLGYVGLPIAVAFSKKADVIGFDINSEKIDAYVQGTDVTREVGDSVLKETTIDFTTDEGRLKEASFFIITVPTPINSNNTPDLRSVITASEIVGRNISGGTVIVYESTVYPGCTEELCIPVIENLSGMKCGQEFKVGYSPERINPGDKEHRLENVCKIISACDDGALDEIRKIYGLVIEAETYPVSNIKTAEAIKVVENSQRDINIAFMNELAMVFDRMGIDTNEVVDGMNTKWNALGFRPGLVGGHCIGVDPYYFIYETEKLGYHSQLILNGRIVNENMGAYIGEVAINQMVLAGLAPMKANVAVFGLTFKENCHDIRNSKVIDVIRKLNKYGIDPVVADPWVIPEEASREYGLAVRELEAVRDMDCVIVAVAHDNFRALSIEDMKRFFRNGKANERVILDVKGIFDIRDLQASGMRYWRL